MEITDCITQWNGSLFNYTVHWRVPDFIAFGSGIFSSFLVDADLELNGGNGDYISSKPILKEPNQTSYSVVWTDFRPRHSQYYYEFGVNYKFHMCGINILYHHSAIDTSLAVVIYSCFLFTGKHPVVRIKGV